MMEWKAVGWLMFAFGMVGLLLGIVSIAGPVVAALFATQGLRIVHNESIRERGVKPPPLPTWFQK